MVKMVSMKRTAADKKAESSADGMLGRGTDRDGVHVHLDHHHIQKMGLDRMPQAGDEVEFAGKGKVVSAHTSDDGDGPRHHMTLMLHRAGVESKGEDADERREGLREDIEKAAEKK